MAYYANNTKFDIRKRWDWHKVDLVAVQSVNPKYFDKVKKDSEKKAREDYFKEAKENAREKATWTVIRKAAKRASLKKK